MFFFTLRRQVQVEVYCDSVKINQQDSSRFPLFLPSGPLPSASSPEWAEWRRSRATSSSESWWTQTARCRSCWCRLCCWSGVWWLFCSHRPGRLSSPEASHSESQHCRGINEPLTGPVEADWRIAAFMSPVSAPGGCFESCAFCHLSVPPLKCQRDKLSNASPPSKNY